jgi:hypothetical protein
MTDLFVLLRVPSLKFENPHLAILFVLGIFESKKLLPILVGRLGSDRQFTSRCTFVSNLSSEMDRGGESMHAGITTSSKAVSVLVIHLSRR